MNLDELERLLEAATPGPWRNFTDIENQWMHELDTNAPLIVAAVNSLPALIAAARSRDDVRKYCELNLSVWDEDGTVAAAITRDLLQKVLNVIETGDPLQSRATLTGEGAPR